MPRKKLVADARSTDRGTNWTCSVHGDLGADVIVLSGVAYCPRDGCKEIVRLTGRAKSGKDYAGYNQFKDLKK